MRATGSAGRVPLFGRITSRLSSPADVWLAVRVMGWALVLPLLKQAVPVKSLARIMHLHPDRVTRSPAREEHIVIFARWAARLIRWKNGGNCLERGLIAYRYLGRAGAHPLLVVGLERVGDSQLVGHAWVLVDGQPVGESLASLTRYTPVFAFGADGAMTEVPPDHVLQLRS